MASLPNEIVLYIARICISNTVRDSCLDPNGIRFHLARICKQWRDTIQSDPSLWTTLLICDLPRNRESALDVLDRFLLFSQDQPLKIYFDSFLQRMLGLSTVQKLDAILRRLLAHHDRWEVFSMTVNWHPSLKRVGIPMDVPFSRLLEMAVHEAVVPFGSCLCAPALEKVSMEITDISVPGKGTDQLKNLTGLTHLRIVDHTSSVVLHILSASLPTAANEMRERMISVENLLRQHPSLTQLHFLSGCPILSQGQEHFLNHPKLEHLVLRSSTQLNNITLPSLQGLHFTKAINLLEQPDDVIVNDIVSFLRRSHCALCSITLDVAFLRETSNVTNNLFALLEPSLTHFRLFTHNKEPSDILTFRTFLEALTHSEAKAGLFPRLTSLSLQFHSHYDKLTVVLPTIVQLLISRRDAGLSTRWKANVLTDVGLDFAHIGNTADGIRGVFESDVRVLREEGLRFWYTRQIYHIDLSPWVENREQVEVALDRPYVPGHSTSWGTGDDYEDDDDYPPLQDVSESGDSDLEVFSSTDVEE